MCACVCVCVCGEGGSVCGVAVLSEKPFCSCLFFCFVYYRLLCKMSVNGVVTRIPVVRNLIAQ